MERLSMFKIWVTAMILICSSSFVQMQSTVGRPPRIIPSPPHEGIVVKSDSTISLRCEGQKPVVWNHSFSEHFDHNEDYESDHDILQRWKVTNTQVRNSKYPFVALLEVAKASYKDTGYFYCLHNGTIDSDDFDNVVKVYVYVKSSTYLLTEEDEGHTFISGHQSMPIVLPCRPTSPDITVMLFKEDVQLYPPIDESTDATEWKFNPHIGFTIDSATISSHSGNYECRAKAPDDNGDHHLQLSVQIQYQQIAGFPQPVIFGPNDVMIGSNLTLECTITFSIGILARLEWTKVMATDRKGNRYTEQKSFKSLGSDQKESAIKIIIQGVSKSDEGEYSCRAFDDKNNRMTSKFVKVHEMTSPTKIISTTTLIPSTDMCEGPQCNDESNSTGQLKSIMLNTIIIVLLTTFLRY